MRHRDRAAASAMLAGLVVLLAAVPAVAQTPPTTLTIDKVWEVVDLPEGEYPVTFEVAFVIGGSWEAADGHPADDLVLMLPAGVALPIPVDAVGYRILAEHVELPAGCRVTNGLPGESDHDGAGDGIRLEQIGFEILPADRSVTAAVTNRGTCADDATPPAPDPPATDPPAPDPTSPEPSSPGAPQATVTSTCDGADLRVDYDLDNVAGEVPVTYELEIGGDVVSVTVAAGEQRSFVEVLSAADARHDVQIRAGGVVLVTGTLDPPSCVPEVLGEIVEDGTDTPDDGATVRADADADGDGDGDGDGDADGDGAGVTRPDGGGTTHADAPIAAATLPETGVSVAGLALAGLLGLLGGGALLDRRPTRRRRSAGAARR